MVDFRRKSTIRFSQQDGDGTFVVVGDGKVEFSVSVEIACSDRLRSLPHREIGASINIRLAGSSRTKTPWAQTAPTTRNKRI